MEFSWGRKRNWECEEKTDSAEEVKEKEIKRKIQEMLELRRKRELEERERKIREKEEFERKKGLEAGDQKKPLAQELERKKNRIESRTDKNIESVRIKELGIKELTADEVNHVRIGLSHDETRGFVKDCTRLEKQGVESTESHKAEVEQIKEERENKVENNELKFLEDGDDELNKIVREYEIKVEGQINKLLVEAKDDFDKTRHEKEIWEKEVEETLNKIIDKSKTIDQLVKEHQIQDRKIEPKDINQIKEISVKEGRAFLAGLVAADGHLEIKDPYITVASKDELFLKDYLAPLINVQIGRLPKPYWDNSARVWKLRIYNRKLWTTLIKDYSIPCGRKSTSILAPKNLESSERIWYARGWFDGEGWVETMTVRKSSRVYQYPRIGFKVKNQPIRDWLLDELTHHNIRAKGYNRNDGTYGLWINGIIDCQTFLDTIGFLYPLRNTKLKELIQKNQGLIFTPK